MTPRLTIGIPVYNGAKYLAATLDSLLAQTVDTFVIVISDNGSTDGTPEICKRYSRLDRRVSVVRHGENRGAAWNYNSLVEHAETPYFKWSGCDDLYAPEYVERCLEEIESNLASPVLVYPRTRLIDADGNETRDYDDGLDLRDADVVVRFDQLLRGLGLANAVFGIMNTEVLRRTALIAPYNDSDVILLMELCLLGAFAEVPSTLFFRRMHREQAYQANTTARSVRQWFDPGARTRFVVPRARRFFEAARTIARAPITPAERVKCESLLFRRWGPRDAYHAARELPAAIEAALVPERSSRA